MIEKEIKAEALKAKKAEEAMHHLYQRVFCGRDRSANQAAELMLTDMLNDLHFFDGRLDTPEKYILNNYARKLLFKIGVWQEFNRWDITQALLSLPKSEPKPQEEE